ncbi:hypothetical protein CcCBS67573_g08626 [Chytriomyces confervae]|uniref:AMP-dependent synthetase/ligase domain-containing protein n=1 Tax=Chytriomyces confervae TaxID=246404 RepID=A0A507EHQ8_9FUNG|nr:hypothetical protein CcCBS67573_g08626 [Chytriomyces confervae]
MELFMHSKYPNKESLVFTANNARFTYKQLDNEVNKAANWLGKNGVAKEMWLRSLKETRTVTAPSAKVLRRDKDNFMYFVDLVGDTFRWNGEIVSTQHTVIGIHHIDTPYSALDLGGQVSDVLPMYAGVHEANVYGVRVPGSEGRAGMAALSASSEFDVKG